MSKLVSACGAAAVLALLVSAGASARTTGPTWSTYIVTLKASAGYSNALNGFAISLPDPAAARLAADPRIESVELDGVVTADAVESPATWGLDRIDQRTLPLSNSYTYNSTGSGVTAYIIGTGIRF